MAYRRKSNVRYNFAVGRKAEKLIREMMEELGFKVVPFGYEHLLREFADKRKLLKGPAGKVVRGQPDFLIVDNETNYASFIEVKYRSQGELNPKQLFEYPESWVILVEQGAISIARVDYVKNGLRKDCFLNLDKIGPFKNKDRKIMLKYVNKTKEEFY